MSFLEWLKLENSKDPDNILPPGLDFEKAISLRDEIKELQEILYSKRR